uniref:Uncharacterized protein n=1 Tax=Odontella aurita TaxID=265563 RepID=A0A7S4MDG8_9STRA|mmetsp:Transcript_18531/g.53425  ORF Transcript_18531/g.53425 Transcript_18531/m.53425 type:complete len:488 (+) Transcript_18531:474-1937(+)|eukprot:CAMPEP_0113545426 /NCGR_PEP_ID=MMETSP0015_2-20120614/11255_1 /TAXON_ID=2838 /ORGANISM="Odontella" /LENGTH=487 /DNA_ID=CAMNT_0000445791 /DNA_START=333 /DNA_END=1796 /DNA_ORIENTATION=+ /assembly_acc=CAM_ASM_000160
MPPNRQSAAAVLRSLSVEDLSGFVTESKYAPLTLDESSAPAAPSKPAPVELQLAEQQQAEVQQEQIEVEDAKPAAANYWDEAGEPEQAEEEPESVSYWGWPSLAERQDSELDAAEAEEVAREEVERWETEVARREAVVAQILAEEAARSVVSTASIEANLIADAERRNASEPVEIIRNTEVVKDADYWDWDAETDTQELVDNSAFAAAHIEGLLKKESIRIKVHSHSPQALGRPQQGYWEWDTLTPDQEKQRVIANILEDEKARLLLSSSRVEANLKNFSSSPSEDVVMNEEKSDSYWDWDNQEEVRAPHTRDPNHPSNSYWDWTPPVTADESKVAVIQRILADEAARQALSVSHIESILKNTVPSPKVGIIRNEGNSDSYWDWNGDEGEPEKQVKAPHTQDPTHPSNSYWDWTPSVTPEDSKAAIIQRILADEAARQALSASHTEETLKGETWSGAKVEVEQWYNHEQEEVVRSEEKAEEVGYWDM